MQVKRITVAAAVALITITGATAAYGATALWSQSATGYYIDAQAANRVPVYEGQAGTGPGDFDKTRTVVAPNGSTYHVLPYTTVDLTQYGVPATAKYAVFGVKAIITKDSNSDSLTDVFAFMRAPGSVCCEGLPSAPLLPIDGGFGQPVEGMVQQAVSQLAGDGQRSWSVVTEPIVNGQIELSWGYQRQPGIWPNGDGVAIDFFLNGYGS